MKTSERMQLDGWHQPFADFGRMTWHTKRAGFYLMVNDGRDGSDAGYAVAGISSDAMKCVKLHGVGLRSIAQRAAAMARKLARRKR
jgi:hypothetical protein